MIYINRFFFGFYDQLRKFYLNSKIYDKKIYAEIKKDDEKFEEKRKRQKKWYDQQKDLR